MLYICHNGPFTAGSGFLSGRGIINGDHDWKVRWYCDKTGINDLLTSFCDLKSRGFSELHIARCIGSKVYHSSCFVNKNVAFNTWNWVVRAASLRRMIVINKKRLTDTCPLYKTKNSAIISKTYFSCLLHPQEDNLLCHSSSEYKKKLNRMIFV